MYCAKISISTLLGVKGKLWWVAFVADDLGGARTPVVMWYSHKTFKILQDLAG